MSFVPLHVHSQYSILEASSPINALAAKAESFKMSSCALTDSGNLYGAVEFFKACKAASVKPILGCELFVAPISRFEKKKIIGMPHGFPIVLLAKNRAGYQNLCKLSSYAHLEGFYYTPRIDKELLGQFHDGLICLSGPINGRIAQLILQGKEEELLLEIQWYQNIFKEDFYFEIQRHPINKNELESWIVQFAQNQEKVIVRLKELSSQSGIGLVATNDSRYLNQEDWKAHEILINIQSGEPCEIWEKDSFGNLKERVLNPKRERLLSSEFYFKSQEEMQALFSDLPESLANTLKIADNCKFEFDFKDRHYPVFTPPNNEAAGDFLRALCFGGIERRYDLKRLEKVKEKYPSRDPLDVVKERLEYELNLIISKGMCDYLLIVYDFIAWAKKQKIPMGPGRGSGAGSIILYLIGITDIEPLGFHLFFERFINPERLSYPDIDVDICMERRSEVIDYTVRKYGKDKVAQIITFGTMKAKMALKDVGRVLSVPLAKVNSLAKLIPEELNITLEKALETDPELRMQYETDKEVKELIDIAKRLEGCVRSAGIHAAGLIISKDPIMDHIPICTAKDSEMVVTQFSMKPVEAVGMLKIDFLGLKTLTSIQKAVDAISKENGPLIDWVNLPLDDKATFAILNQGRTLGIFQVESAGMQDLSKQIHIDCFEEIIAVCALYRPGPMEMIPSFINRKHGKEAIDIDHPLMHDILSETYGIMVYQEQVMQIASLLANYSLGEGDVLRRAMGKKDKEEMARQREKFKRGAKERGIDEETSMRIFDKVEKFASYGFNKSHAAAYGYLTYVTAYLKAHFPKEWMAALMTSDRDDTTKVARIIRECQLMHIAVLPPDVNESEKEFVARDVGIRFALTAIKGIGEGVVSSIIEERKKRGPYASLYDFVQRIGTKKVGKKGIETLIEAGSFDFTNWSRQALLMSVEPMYETAAVAQKEEERGFINLFSLLQEENKPFAKPPDVSGEISKQKMLRREKELLGFYLTGNPMHDFAHLIEKLSCTPLSKLEELEAESIACVVFSIESIQMRIAAKSQRKFAILTICEEETLLELPIWPELYESKHEQLVENQLLIAVIHVDHEKKLQCKYLEDLTQLNEEKMHALTEAFERSKKSKSSFKKKEITKEESAKLIVQFDAEKMRLSHVLELKNLFRSFPGRTRIQMEFYAKEKTIGTLLIPPEWGIQFDNQIEDRLRRQKAFKSLRLLTELANQ